MKPRKAAISRLTQFSRSYFGALEIRQLNGDKPFGRTSVIHEHMPPGCRLPNIFHRRTEELIVILRGRVVGVLNGRRVILREGHVVRLPPGTRHQFSTGKKGADCISIFTPPLSFRKLDVVKA